MSTVTTPPEELKARALKLASERAAPTRRATRVTNGVLLGAGLLLLGALLWQLGGLNLGERAVPLVVASTVAWIALALGATWLALGRAGQMGGRPTRTLLIATVGAPVLLLGALLLLNGFYPPEPCPPSISWWGQRCHEFIIAISAVMFTAFAVILRFGDPVHPKAGGAALGLAAGSWAGLVLNLNCSCADSAHVGFGHVLPVAVASLLGAGLGWWLLRLRRVGR